MFGARGRDARRCIRRPAGYSETCRRLPVLHGCVVFMAAGSSPRRLAPFTRASNEARLKAIFRPRCKTRQQSEAANRPEHAPQAGSRFRELGSAVPRVDDIAVVVRGHAGGAQTGGNALAGICARLESRGIVRSCHGPSGFPETNNDRGNALANSQTIPAVLQESSGTVNKPRRRFGVQLVTYAGVHCLSLGARVCGRLHGCPLQALP